MLICFDFDGVILDTRLGMTSSINHALIKLGESTVHQDKITELIGPPLSAIFSKLLSQKNQGRAEEAISYFRDDFEQGYLKSVVYQEMLNLLQSLKASGHVLTIVTSRRQSILDKMLHSFDLKSYFLKALGCGTTYTKETLLTELKTLYPHQDNYIMIGDRDSDMIAGKIAEYLTIGVSWGYSRRGELEKEGPDFIVTNPEELLSIIKSF